MTLDEASELFNGFHVFEWKDGVSSLVVVGRLHDGTPWFAAATRVADGPEKIASVSWGDVLEARPMMSVAEYKELEQVSRGKDLVALDSGN